MVRYADATKDGERNYQLLVLSVAELSIINYQLSMDTTTLIPIFGTAAFGLLVIVTLGIVYLTISGWRDRQRREDDRRTNRKSRG